MPDPRWHEIYRLADIISPWMPGRLHSSAEVRIHTETDWIPDMKWCAENGLEYMPVVYPGFGWVNLKNEASANISRQDGRFLWEQYRCLVEAGSTMVYQAMFDEIDEGTQICKIDNNPPVSEKNTFLTYEPLPEDHYLWLVGEAGRMLRGEIPPSPSQPPRPGHDEVNRYLADGDAAFFQTLEARVDQLRATGASKID